MMALIDITESECAEQELRDTEQKLALAASGTRIGIFDRNITAGEILATDQHAHLLGLRTTTTTTTTTLSQRYHYRDWAERVHSEDLPRVEAEMSRCMAEHAPFESEYRVVWLDGSVHWVGVRAAYQYDADGRPHRLLGVLMDITDRKRAQEALQQLNEDLERRVDERTTELRVLASRLADAQEEERQRIAEGLHDEVCQLLAACQLKLAEARDSKDLEKRNRLVDAADGLLNEASDEVRGLTFELSAASLFDGGFAAAARDLCAYMTESHGVKFEVNCANEDLGIPERLRPTLYHSLRELLHNVVRHAGVDQATVWIEETVVGEEAKTDNRQPSADNRLIRVTVRDYGKGFNPRDLNRPITRKGGFGLRHLRERMRDVGGELLIESVPGDGTKAVLEVSVGGVVCDRWSEEDTEHR